MKARPTTARFSNPPTVSRLRSTVKEKAGIANEAYKNTAAAV